MKRELMKVGVTVLMNGFPYIHLKFNPSLPRLRRALRMT